MPAAMGADAAPANMPEIKSPQNGERANIGDVASPRGSHMASSHVLREKTDGANGVRRTSGDELVLTSPERRVQSQVDASYAPLKGWEELENNIPGNGWTEVKSKGSVRSKVSAKKRMADDIAITEDTDTVSPTRQIPDTTKVSKLSPDKLIELTSAPDALPIQSLRSVVDSTPSKNRAASINISSARYVEDGFDPQSRANATQSELSPLTNDKHPLQPPLSRADKRSASERPAFGTRSTSTPLMKRKLSGNKMNGITPISIPKSRQSRNAFDSFHARDVGTDPRGLKPDDRLPSPFAHSIPLPPLSVPTHLQLEVSSSRPSPLYLYRAPEIDHPYEPTQIKLERLQNFLFLPPQLEQVLWFGTLACFDAWLYTFTILPIRFGKSLSMLGSSWARNLSAEISFISHFIYVGVGRMWKRRSAKPSHLPTEAMLRSEQTPEQSKTKRRVPSPAGRFTEETPSARYSQPNSSRARTSRTHRRTRSEPSKLLPVEKADILKGLLIIISCYILMYFDASMMYHNIRGQAAIKLYVIYNALEVGSPIFY